MATAVPSEACHLDRNADSKKRPDGCPGALLSCVVTGGHFATNIFLAPSRWLSITISYR